VTEAPAPVVAAEERAEVTADEHVAPSAPVQPAPRGGPASQSLREEIRLIDSARVAVKKNEGARAVGILEQYARRFPHGTFREEAKLLRAEALKKP
jgi:hypothetical protein